MKYILLLGELSLTDGAFSLLSDNQPLFLDLGQKLSMYLPKSWRKNILKVEFLKLKYFEK